MRRFLLLFLLIMLTGCARQPVANDTTPTELWPTSGWQTGTPESQGLDGAVLEKMQAEIKSSGLALDSLLIIRNGVLVSESYYNGASQDDLHEQHSVTKSFTSTLIGIASDQGKLRIDQTVGDYFPNRSFANPDPRKTAITVENLLTMSSGLGWVEANSSFGGLYNSQDWTQWMLDLPQSDDPGKTFKYCSGCSHVLSAMLSQAVGGDELRFADENLFRPLGIQQYGWEKDAQGLPIGGWGLTLSARDMAKLGYLYLHDGRWEGRQILSSSWVQAASAKHISTDGNLGYGYQWWTYYSHDAYTALGRAGQTIFVLPTLNMVVVTTANLTGGHEPIFKLIDEYILPAAEGAALGQTSPSAQPTVMPSGLTFIEFYSPL